MRPEKACPGSHDPVKARFRRDESSSCHAKPQNSRKHPSNGPPDPLRSSLTSPPPSHLGFPIGSSHGLSTAAPAEFLAHVAPESTNLRPSHSAAAATAAETAAPGMGPPGPSSPPPCVAPTSREGSFASAHTTGSLRIALLEFRLPPCHLEDGNRDEMAEGFLAAMASSGVEINPRWVRRNLHPCTPGAGWEDFRRIWTAQREKPDGLLICDDNLFPGAATAICQLGIRVPGDLAVVSHFVRGNSNVTVPFPVTKLEFDPDLYVQVMGETLLKLMRKEPVASAEVKLPCRLMEASGGGSARGPGGRGTLVTAIPAAECRDGELALLGGI